MSTAQVAPGPLDTPASTVRTAAGRRARSNVDGRNCACTSLSSSSCPRMSDTSSCAPRRNGTTPATRSCSTRAIPPIRCTSSRRGVRGTQLEHARPGLIVDVFRSGRSSANCACSAAEPVRSATVAAIAGGTYPPCCGGSTSSVCGPAPRGPASRPVPVEGVGGSEPGVDLARDRAVVHDDLEADRAAVAPSAASSASSTTTTVGCDSAGRTDDVVRDQRATVNRVLRDLERRRIVDLGRGGAGSSTWRS